MKSKSSEQIAQEQTRDQRITMRFLIEDPIACWRMFPVAKAMRAYRGGLQVPELSGRTIRVVLALVILDGRKISEIHRLEPAEWKLDSEGRVDRGERHIEFLIATAFDGELLPSQFRVFQQNPAIAVSGSV